MNRLEKIINLVKEINPEHHTTLLTLNIINKFSAFNMGPDPLTTYLTPNCSHNMTENRESSSILMKEFVIFIVELLAVYGNGSKVLRVSETQNPDEISLEYLYKLRYNCALLINKDLSSLGTMVIQSEHQMLFQTDFLINLTRIYYIFAKDEVSTSIFIDLYGISIKAYIALSFELYIHLIKNSDKIHLMNEELLIKGYGEAYNDEEIQSYIKLVTLKKDDYHQLYSLIRTKNGKSLSVKDLEGIESSGLPKINVLFPFKTINEGLYRLHSLTSFNIFMHMKSVYFHLALNSKKLNPSLNYEAKYAGPLFEKYLFELALEHSEKSKTNANVIKEHAYKIGKEEFRSPDIIIEFNDYIIFIEAKLTPFYIDLIKSLEIKSLKKFKKDIIQSQKNINRYTNYHNNRFKDKKSINFLVYLNSSISTQFIINSELKTLLNGLNIIPISVSTFELLFSGHPLNIYKTLMQLKQDPKYYNIDYHLSKTICDMHIKEHSIIESRQNNIIYELFDLNTV